MWDDLIKDCPYHISKIEENPLSEDEVIELIKDNNLSDKQVLNICQLLRQKWGRKVITSNIAEKLVKRKSILDQFFTLIKLDDKTNIHFKTKKEKFSQDL